MNWSAGYAKLQWLKERAGYVRYIVYTELVAHAHEADTRPSFEGLRTRLGYHSLVPSPQSRAGKGSGDETKDTKND